MLDLNFAHFLIGSLKRFLLWYLFLFFFVCHFRFNNFRLMSQVNMMKKNMASLDMNLGQLVRSVPYLVVFCANNDACSILVRLLFSDLSVVNL